MRLLTLWLVVLAVPTLFLTISLVRLLAPELNYSISAVSMASKFTIGSFVDLGNLPEVTGGAVSSLVVIAAMFMFLTSAWLNALSLGATKAFGRPKFKVLIANANGAYWSMVRIGLWSLVPIGVVLLISKISGHMIANVDDHAVLESTAEHLRWIERPVTLLLFALAECSIETARAVLVAHPRRKSVVGAWFAGLSFLRRNPLRIFGSWLVITVPILILVAILMVLRINLDQGSVFGFIGALILAELMVLSLAWMRCTRIFAMVDLVSQSSAIR